LSARLREGDKAPDFTLAAQDGSKVSLRDFEGRKNVVLYFYPKDFTAGCTAETKAFGDSYESIASMGAEVIGISSDSEESHGRFAAECGARFVLLSDPGRRVAGLYGVSRAFGLIPGRVTFVIDKAGVVRSIFSSQLNPRRHVMEALVVLKAIS
jgi:peroxiredoxin Q/BCP